MGKYLIIHKAWTTYGGDGNLLDFGLKTIKHKESFAEWNDKKRDWDYVNVPCNCEICLEENANKQLKLFI